MEKEISCHLCGGKARLKFEELYLDEGRITIKESPYYECMKCHGAFATSEQMKELSRQINTKFVFQRQVINAGRSLAITLPADLAQFYHLKKGRKIKLIPETGHALKIEV
ncbi:AbrB/MazE/SpoVT family DNA-binding domain-containing protein [archaeon]|nr:AbrB/MazE/SpoVT family DNA-binding domain-containing protein [archaeon]